MLIGFHVAGAITDLYASGNVHDWHSIWICPAVLAALTFFGIRIHFQKRGTEISPLSGLITIYRASSRPGGHLMAVELGQATA